jgi:hypothetical protein
MPFKKQMDPEKRNRKVKSLCVNQDLSRRIEAYRNTLALDPHSELRPAESAVVRHLIELGLEQVEAGR